MPKIESYKLLEGDSVHTLNAKVAEHLAQNYEVYGMPLQISGYACQAVVKFAEVKKKESKNRVIGFVREKEENKC